MKLYCRPYGQLVFSRDYPYAVLWDDNWDDYGFKTTFAVEIHIGPNDVAGLGETKVLSRGLKSGERTELPDEFESLPETYCSLGQAYTYYEILRELGEDVYTQFLAAMRDVIFLPKLRDAFTNELAFETSLLRGGGARRTLEDAPRIFWHGAGAGLTELEFDFETRVGGSTFRTSFNFGDRKALPNRINAVIGYNGVGKTTLLANLAMVASADEAQRTSMRFMQQYGAFRGEQPIFGSTIAISYSAFDTFEVPGRTAAERNRIEKTGELLGYTYCGLRRFSDEPDGSDDTTQLQLKGSSEITDEFFRALRIAQSEARQQILERALSTLTLEPSFSRVDTAGFFASTDDFEHLKRQMATFSTGHKIVFNIVVQLVAHLQMRSLVLIDEPESHLHPPLLAALLRSVGVALVERDSVAVIATHSPVVIQEIPKRYVRVLRRFGNKTQVDTPDSETFGENVGYLTKTVFNLDSSQTDYHRVLDGLAHRFTLEQIEEMFDGEMSAQARAYVVGQLRRRA